MNTKLTIFFALVLSVAVGVAVFFWQQVKIESLMNQDQEVVVEDEPVVETTEALDTFHYDEASYTYYGNLVASGYVTTEEMTEGFCEVDCKTFTYAFFNILESENGVLDEYLNGQKGNSFTGDMSIGLGCVTDGVVWRMNHSDDFGMKKYVNSGQESTTLLNSTPETPISIAIERYLFTGGSGAPDCYSHFANVSIQ